MPIYEYVCMECESHFEELVRSAEQAVAAPTAAPATSASSSRRSRSPASRRSPVRRRAAAAAAAAAPAAAAARRPAADDRFRRDARAHRVHGRDRGLHALPARARRTQVVFGSGHPDADLMFVGEAPGFHEDKQGVPFVGQAGKLLEKLLAGIGLRARTSTSRTCSNAARPETATRSRTRSRPARRISGGRSS